MGAASLPALQRTVLDLIHEYEDKRAYMPKAIADFDEAFDALGMAATVQGAYIGPVGSKSYLHESVLQKNLLASGWKAIYNRLDIDRITSAKDKQLFERTLADPPPLTFDNAKATFRDYLERPRYHIPGRQLSALLGHDDPDGDVKPTTKKYIHLRPEYMTAAVKALSTIWLRVQREANAYGAVHSLSIPRSEGGIILDKMTVIRKDNCVFCDGGR